MTTSTKFAKDHTWLYERVARLVGKERLEEAEGQAAAYWEQAIDGIDQAQLRKALVRLFGKKEGKRLLLLGRSERVKRMAAAEADALVRRLSEKIAVVVVGPGDRLESGGLRLEEHPYSEAKTLHEGVEYYHRVDGLMCFTGVVAVHHENGGTSTVNVFSRWVSHPFWQYGYVATAAKMNWLVVYADDDESWYELFMIGYIREDAIAAAWEAVGDDAPNFISAELLPDAELPYVNPDSVIRADSKKHPKNRHGGVRMFQIK